MSYDPGIPNPQDKISQSQPKLRVNFNQLNAVFSVDHVEYNNASINKRGFHRKVTYEAPITDPNISITDVATLYTKKPSAVELFFQNGPLAANVFQLTNSALPVTSGSGTTVNGLQIRCGVGPASNTPGTLTTFTPAFPTACVAVVACAFNSGAQVNVNALTAANFRAISAAGAVNMYYIAIGY